MSHFHLDFVSDVLVCCSLSGHFFMLLECGPISASTYVHYVYIGDHIPISSLFYRGFTSVGS
jgi:hypothetical protein